MTIIKSLRKSYVQVIKYIYVLRKGNVILPPPNIVVRKVGYSLFAPWYNKTLSQSGSQVIFSENCRLLTPIKVYFDLVITVIGVTSIEISINPLLKIIQKVKLLVYKVLCVTEPPVFYYPDSLLELIVKTSFLSLLQPS